MAIRRSLVVLLSIFLVVAVSSPSSAAGEPLLVTHRPPFLSSESGRDIVLNVAASPSQRVVLQYRHRNERSVTIVDAVEKEHGLYSAVIPAAATKAPGVWYRFQTSTPTGETLETQEYFIQTVDGPVELAASPPVGTSIAWDIQAKGGVLPRGSSQPSTSSACPLPSYLPVDSKLLELRSTGSSPHTGVDIPCGGGTEVFAMQAGYVVFATTASDGMKYVVLGHGEKLSSNPDTYQYYTHYFHLSSWESGLDRGVYVSKGQRIGHSGDTGSPESFHLDFGFDTGGTSSAAWDPNRRVLPARYFFPGASAWNNGYDLDFAQPPQSAYSQNYGTYIDINVYPKGIVDSQTLTVTLKYREAGTTGWSSSPMNKVGTSSVYRGYFGSGVWDKTVEYYVSIARNGISGFVTRPVEKYAAEPSYFYQVYVSPPVNPKIPQE